MLCPTAWICFPRERSPHQRQSQHPPHIFTVLNFFSKFLFVPITFACDQVSGLCKLQRHSRAKTAACFFLQVGSIIVTTYTWGGYAIRQYKIRDDFMTPLLNIVGTIGGIVMTILYLNLVWFNSQKLLEVGRKASAHGHFTRSTFKKTVMGGYFCFIGLTILNILSKEKSNEGVDWEGELTAFFYSFICPTTVLNTNLTKSNSSCSLYSSSPRNDSGQCVHSVIEFLVIALKIVYYVITQYASHFYLMPKVLLITLAVTMYNVGKAFRIKMQNCRSTDMGMKHYTNLKHFQNEVNDICNTLMLFYYVTCLAMFSETPYSLNFKKVRNISSLVRNFWSYSVHLLFWVVATLYHRIVQGTVNEWMKKMESSSEEHQEISDRDRLKLLAFGRHIDWDPVGFSSGFFTVNYQLVGSMVGIVITYAFIVLQISKP